jgi:hypothetical protein
MDWTAVAPANLPQAVSVLHPQLLDVGKIETDIVFCCTDTVVVQQDEIFLRQLFPLVQPSESRFRGNWTVDLLRVGFRKTA